MYLTRIALNTEKKNTRMALSSPNMIHGALGALFEGERPRLLWRIDKLSERYYILILHGDTPDFSPFVSQFGFDGDKAETRDYGVLLDRVGVGTKWIFRLNANPTYRNPRQNGEQRAKRHAYVTVDKQEKWLTDNCEKYGFSLDEGSFKVVGTKWYRFHKDSNAPITLLSVTYEGVLSVTDEELFKKALCGGIGREKAYGLGLITLMRYEN